MAATRVPGPSSFAALSNVRRFLNNRALFLHEMWAEYGDLYRFQLGTFEVYFINRPEWVREALLEHDRFPKSKVIDFLAIVLGRGLVTARGDAHRRQRRIMQPAFHKPRIAKYADDMAAQAQRSTEAWVDKDTVDIHQAMMGLTMEVVAAALFGTSVDGVVPRVCGALDRIIPVVDRIAQPTGALKMKLPLRSTRNFYRSLADLDDLIYGIIKQARETIDAQDNLLGTLIRATDTEGDGTGLNDVQLRDEVMTLFLAGHETTAVALTWTWYLLATHPEVEARLHAELDEVLGGRTPGFDDLPNLTYTRKIISESLRLYPPVYLLDRITTDTWEVGGYAIPKGKFLMLAPYSMGRHPEFYPDPDRFDPERWTAEEVAKRPRFAFYPFGGGPRICIGEHFAWTEMILVVATIAQHWRLATTDQTTGDFKPQISLRPAHGMPLRLHARTGAEAGVRA